MKKITLLLCLLIMSLAYGQPGSPAPTPTNANIDVISVYSDAYTSIATNLDPSWGQATDATDIQISGNQTLSYSGLDYQGLDYTSSDVSAMEYVHLDYYTTDATSFQFFLIGGGENAYDIAATDGITTGQWVSIDIPLSHYTVPNLAQVAQFKTVGNGTLYLDNLYFWKAPAAAGTDTSLSDLTVDGNTISGFSSLGSNYSVELPSGTVAVPTVVATTTDSNANNTVTPAASLPGSTTILVTAQDGTTTNTITINFTLDPTPATAAPVPTKSSSDVISVYSDTYTSIATDLNPSWGQATTMTEIQITANNTLKYANLNYQGIEYTSSDVTAMEYIHLDYHTSDATAFQFFLIAGGENGYDIAATDGITTGQWVGIDIPLSYYLNAGRNLATAIQFKTVGNGTIFLDNIYFWKTTVDPVTDATLTDVKVDSETIADFSSAVINYEVVLPKGTTTVPQITLATKSHSGANAVITQAPQLPGDATVVVTSEDGNTTKTYTISFSVNNNSACEGTSSDATEGSFSVGYDYHFETLETGTTDVKVTFTLLDEDKVGYVPQAFIAPSTFINMAADGSTYTATLTDQTGTISFSIRGAHSTGLVTSQLFEYTVGDTCDALSTQNFEIVGLEIYPNPTSASWNFNTKDQNIESIEIIDMTGKIVFTITPKTSSTVIDGTNLPAGMYISRITTEKGTQSKTLIRN